MTHWLNRISHSQRFRLLLLVTSAVVMGGLVLTTNAPVHAEPGIIASKTDIALRTGETQSFTISLTEQPDDSIVYFTMHVGENGPALLSTPDSSPEYAEPSSTIYFSVHRSNWQRPVTVNVHGVGVGVIQAGLYVSASGNYAGARPPDIFIDVTQGTAKISIADVAAEEGTPLNFQVSVWPTRQETITLTYSIIEGTATSSDYTVPNPPSITIDGNTASAIISIPTTEDYAVETDEQFTLALGAAPPGTVITAATATGIINNDDVLSVISIADTAAEEGTPVEFPISVRPAHPQPITLTYSITNVTATSSDYTVPNLQSVTIGANTTSATISIPTTEDQDIEADEQFTLTLAGAHSGTAFDDATATGTISNDDFPPTIRIADAAADEGDPINFQVTVAPTHNASFTLTYSTADGSAAASDYTGTQSGSVTFNANQSSASIQIPTTADQDVEPDETFSLTIAGAPSVTALGRAKATGTIRNDDQPAEISIADAQATEGSPVVFTVTVSKALAAPIALSYRTAAASASDTDFTGVTAGSLTIPAGNTAGEITIQTVDDYDHESDEQFHVIISTTTPNAEVVQAKATGTIKPDDDKRPGLTITTQPVNEGDLAVFTITMHPPRVVPTTLTYIATHFGNYFAYTGLAGPDDLASVKEGRVTIPAYETSATVLVQTHVDEHSEPDEKFYFEVRGVPEDIPGASSRALDAWIKDVPGHPVRIVLSHHSHSMYSAQSRSYTVKLSADPERDVTVEITNSLPDLMQVSDTSLEFTSGADGNWDTPQRVVVQGTPNPAYTVATARLTHRLEDPGSPLPTRPEFITVKSVDGVRFITNHLGRLSRQTTALDEGGRVYTYHLKVMERGSFEVRALGEAQRTTKSGVVHTCNFETGTPCDWSGVRLSHDRWIQGPNMPPFIKVTPIEDDDHYDTRVQLRHKVPVAPRSTVDEIIKLTVKDNDQPHLDFDTTAGIVGKTPLIISENGAVKTFKVRLGTNPLHEVKLSIVSNQPGSLMVDTPTLTFDGDTWDQWQTVQLSAPVDGNTDDEHATLTFTASKYHKDSEGTHTEQRFVNVNDTVLGPNVMISPAALSLTELGTAESYNASLTTDPGSGATVTVTVSNPNPELVTVSPSSLTFTGGSGGDWNAGKEIQVTPLRDQNATADQVKLSHSVTGYAGVTSVIDVTVNISDSVGPDRVLITPTALDLEEIGPARSYDVALATDPGQDVIVNIANSQSSLVSVSPASLTFTGGSDGDWNVAKQVNVSALEDGNKTTDQVTLSHAVSGYRSVTTAPDVQLTIADLAALDGVKVSPVSIDLVEGEAAKSYEVTLLTNPGQDATVTITNPQPAAVSVSQNELVFTALNWDQPQRVEVTALMDADTDDHQVSLSHAVSGYRDVTSAPSVSLSIDDRPSVRLDVFQGSVTVREQTVHGFYWIRLKENPTAVVSLRFVVNSPGKINLTPQQGSTLQFNAGNWDRYQAVRIDATGDGDAEDQSVTIKHVSDLWAIMENPLITVTIVDDDK